MRTDKVFHVISNTHWDREWRFPFQTNRQMLVDMIDAAISILENNPDYRAYHLDNQTIVIQDYLEIKPQNKKRIAKLVKEDRLLVGPWHILPEEFQVGGENLIRNLLAGHRIAADLGKVCKSGYSPFSWGQISQLPQIYKGFGISVIMFYRGINALKAPHAEFIWEGADGTKAVTSRFSTMPRYNFYFYIYRPVFHNEGLYDIEYSWSRGGTPFHMADHKGCGQDYSLIAPDNSYYPGNIQSAVETIINKQADDFTTPHVLWMEGHDSSGPNAITTNIIRDIKEHFPGLDVRHSTLEEYAALIEEHINLKKVPVIKGEMRYSQFDYNSGNLYGYTTSARMYLKQINFEVENRLQFYAEPFTAFAAALGKDWNDRYIDIAWDLLIQNSAHDSIGGCSLDAIHEDMINRYKQALEIADGVYERALKHIIKRIHLPETKAENNDNKAIYLVAFNPTTFTRSEVTEACIDIPVGFENAVPAIYDLEGKEVPVQIIDSHYTEPVLEQMTNRPMHFSMQRYRLYLELPSVPAAGFKAFSVIPSKKRKNTLAQLGSANRKGYALENSFVKVVVKNNGTLSIVHKDTGRKYSDIGYFTDEGEAGHAWVHTPVNPVINTKQSKPVIKLIENGPLSASVEVRHNLKLPLNLDERKKKKSKTRACKLSFTITLRKDTPRIDMRVTFDNKAEDHRLRIHFPTDCIASYHRAEGQFDLIKRPVERPDTKGWVEQPMYDYPLHHFMDIRDDKNGCALIVDGLKEYEVMNDKRQTIALTLLRAFHYVIQPSSKQDYADQKGSQCPGSHTFRFSFLPYAANTNDNFIFRNALSHNLPLSLVQSGSSKGNLHAGFSFLSIEPDLLQFSTLKKPEHSKDSFILRLYNPSDKSVSGSVRFFQPLKNAALVTLEEKHIKDLHIGKDNSIPVKAGKKEIVTIEFSLKS